MKAKKSVPVWEKAYVLFLSWLIPGYGYYHNGMRRRAIFFFIVLETTFLLGALFRGSVLLPEFNYRDEGFNLVTILTFVTQMCNGLLGLVSLLPDLTKGVLRILPYNETSHWFDLGSFYLLVSGGMNYFVLVNTYDYFYGRKAALLGNSAPAGGVER